MQVREEKNRLLSFLGGPGSKELHNIQTLKVVGFIVEFFFIFGRGCILLIRTDVVENEPKRQHLMP